MLGMTHFLSLLPYSLEYKQSVLNRDLSKKSVFRDGFKADCSFQRSWLRDSGKEEIFKKKILIPNHLGKFFCRKLLVKET
jgi:hypothetical protein